MKIFKKVLSLLLAVILTVCVVPMTDMGITAQAVSGNDIVAYARQFMGYPYVWGTQGPNSFDCSGFVHYVFKHFGMNMPAGSSYYWNNPTAYGTVVGYGTTANAQAGDIISWSGHVAIYTENGKCIEALNPTYGVCERFKVDAHTNGLNYRVIRPNFSGSSSISYASIANGEYYLKNNSSGQYLAVSEGKDANGQPINLWNKSSQFRVSITKDSNGYVMRFPGVSSSRVVNQYADAPKDGTKVTLYNYSGSSSQSWGFQQVSGGYVIRSMYNSNLCLTGNGSSVATVTNYTGASNQIWSLESYNSDKTAPTVSNVQVKNITSDGYDVTCTVSDNVGVTRVAFPTWTLLNDQDDIKWKDGTISGSTASFHVSIADHNNENGYYMTHIYAYDAAGNSYCKHLSTITVPLKGIAETITYNGNEYILYSGTVDTKYAAEYCKSVGGHLATITSQDENDAITEMLLGYNAAFWIDGSDSDSEGVWKFSDGQAMTYFNWQSGEPNNCYDNQDYIRLCSDGSWDDVDYKEAVSAYIMGFICEKEHTHSYKSTIAEYATCTEAGERKYVCDCGDSYTKTITKLGHDFSDEWTIDEEPTCTTDGYKSHHCVRCDEICDITTLEATGHNYTSKVTKKATCSSTGKRKYTCSECGKSYTKSIAMLEHNYKAKTTKKATCSANGVKTYTCSECGDSYTKSIAKLSHTYKTTTTKKATTSKDGTRTTKCTVCDKVKSTSKIYRIKSVTLSHATFTYNGNTKKPTVTVKDSKGNKLVKDTDYTVKYSSGRKNIGQYTATVTFKGKYSGTKKLTFKIVPGKVTSVKQIDKKGINFKWNKVAGASGYQVYRYNSSKGEYERFTTISGTSIGNSSAKGSMKVKVRAYKKVNNKTYYGAFSTPVTIKAKK